MKNVPKSETFTPGNELNGGIQTPQRFLCTYNATEEAEIPPGWINYDIPELLP